MAPLNLPLPTQYQGDTWPGFTLEAVLFDGAVPVINVLEAKLQFRSDTGELGFEMKSNSTDACKGSIIIQDPALWAISIVPTVLPLDARMWWWDLELTTETAVVITILKGRLRITSDITKR